MPRGGRREGAGRKPQHEGVPRVKRVSPSRELVVAKASIDDEMHDRERTQQQQERQAAAAPTLSPARMRAIEVMEDNMNWCMTAADKFLEKAKTAVENGEPANVAVDWFNESRKLRIMGQKCASDLAPYQDARLSATVPAPLPDAPVHGGALQAEDKLAHLTERFNKGRDGLKVVNGGKG